MSLRTQRKTLELPMRISGNKLKSWSPCVEDGDKDLDTQKTTSKHSSTILNGKTHSRFNREIASRTLHNLVVFVQPTAFNMWEDVKGPSDLLEASLVKLAKYQEPTNVGLQRMVKATRTDISVMVARLDDLIVKPKSGYVTKLSDINILQEDLKKIMRRDEENEKR